MSKMMKAIRVSEFGAPSVLKLCSDVPVPKPGKGQVLIRVSSCGVNPVEAFIRSGAFPHKPALPYTPGSDAAGVVEAIGEGVCALKAGEHVYTTGTVTGAYAEFTVADINSVHKLPKKMEFTHGAALGVPYFTAYRALIQKGGAKPGQTVLIHGASGGVGIAACQMANALGLKVLGTAGTPQGLELVLKNGAHHSFNHREEGYINKIMNATGGKGIDVILEMKPGVNLKKDLQLLSSGGRVMIVGAGVPIEIDPSETMFKESSIRGISLYTATPEEIQECAAFLSSGMEFGWLRPVIATEYILGKASDAHHDIIKSAGAAGKLVLKL